MNDADFLREFEDAMADGLDRLEVAIHERGCEGWEKPVFQQGVEVGRVREFSDTAGLRMLEARRAPIWHQPREVPVAANPQDTAALVAALLPLMMKSVPPPQPNGVLGSPEIRTAS